MHGGKNEWINKLRIGDLFPDFRISDLFKLNIYLHDKLLDVGLWTTTPVFFLPVMIHLGKENHGVMDTLPSSK